MKAKQSKILPRMSWDCCGRLTTAEGEAALLTAGLPPDPLDWTTDKMVLQASEVLNAAAARKRGCPHD